MKRIFTSGWFFCFVIIALVGCAVALGGKPAWQKSDERISDHIASQLETAVPYPTSQMRDSVERRNLRERLLRFNKPDKVGYVYLLALNGEYVGYYAIKG